VTSHSSQGQTADRVLVHVNTKKSELLIDNRFAYVCVSRGQYDADIQAARKCDPLSPKLGCPLFAAFPANRNGRAQAARP